jgi:hypothetical protein
MIKVFNVWNLIIFVIIILYLIYTFRFFLVFRKSVIFTGKIKTSHVVLIWMIPFIWIFILRTLTKPIPGSYEEKGKESTPPFSDVYTDANKASGMGF